MKFFTFWAFALILSLGAPRAAQAYRLAAAGSVDPCSKDSAVTVLTPSCREAWVSWNHSVTPRIASTGRYSLVLMQDITTAAATLPAPAWGTAYIASFYFGAGQQVGAGHYAVYAGAATSVRVSGLIPDHTYRVEVISYCDASPEFPDETGPLYATVDPARVTTSITQPQCVSTPAPTLGAHGATALVLDCSTIRLSVHKGNGAGRMLVVQRVGAPGAVSPAPVNGTYYFPSPYFGQGQAVSPGSFVVQLGQDTTATVYGLLQNTAYKFFAFEYNADMFGQQPSYTAPQDTANVYVPGCLAPEPTLAARNLVQTDTAATTAKLQ